MNDDIDDRAIDAFNMACGTTRKPEVFTNDPTVDFNIRTRLRSDTTEDAPMFNVGGSALQGLMAGAKASRSVGNMRAAIRVVEEAHGAVEDAEVTYACRKANLTPLMDSEALRWTHSDTSRLRGT